jgi:hypothetical protein
VAYQSTCRARAALRPGEALFAHLTSASSQSSKSASAMISGRCSIRSLVPAMSATASLLYEESVGCQHLSLRHSALGKISRPEIRVPKIPSICGHLCEKLRTAGMAVRPIFVSHGPTFSEAPDCAEKARRR